MYIFVLCFQALKEFNATSARIVHTHINTHRHIHTSYTFTHNRTDSSDPGRVHLWTPYMYNNCTEHTNEWSSLLFDRTIRLFCAQTTSYNVLILGVYPMSCLFAKRKHADRRMTLSCLCVCCCMCE